MTDGTTESPIFTLGLALAAWLRLSDWDVNRPRRKAWGETKQHEIDLAATLWFARVQAYLRGINAGDRRIAYRRILLIGLGNELGSRKSGRDLEEFLGLLEHLILWLQSRYPIVFEAIDAKLVHQVVEWWSDGRLGRDHIPQPDGSIRVTSCEGSTPSRGRRLQGEPPLQSNRYISNS